MSGKPGASADVWRVGEFVEIRLQRGFGVVQVLRERLGLVDARVMSGEFRVDLPGSEATHRATGDVICFQRGQCLGSKVVK